MSLSPVYPRIAGLLVARVFTSVLTFMNRVREHLSVLSGQIHVAKTCLLDFSVI